MVGTSNSIPRDVFVLDVIFAFLALTAWSIVLAAYTMLTEL